MQATTDKNHYKLLKEDFFQMKGNQFEFIDGELVGFSKGLKDQKSPEEILSERAGRYELKSSQKLCDSLFAFEQIMTTHMCRTQMRVATPLRELFKERNLEEWILFYLEHYFISQDIGKPVFFNLKKKGLFKQDNKIKLIYSKSEEFLHRKLKIFESNACQRLNHLFYKLQMSRITSRESYEAFKCSVLPYFEANLTKSVFAYFRVFLEMDDSWNGDWYIYDTYLLVEDLLAEYEKNKEFFLPLKKTEVELADLLFVSMLIKLIKIGVTEYNEVFKLNFESLSQHFAQFEKENNFI